MKAKFEDIPSVKGTSSFHAYRFQVPFFEFKWHYHPEYELTYIVKGSGYRIVGNSYEQFSDGDLVLLGSNLPHTWTGKLDNTVASDAVVIQFSKEFIMPFLGWHESNQIKQLLAHSDRGLRIAVDELLVSNIMELPNIHGIDKILKLVWILEEITKRECDYIATNTFHNVVSKKNELRINKVCTFLQNNFNQKISLQQVADLIYLTESNFCKFFKKATGKTYSDYLNELRINEACRMLVQTEQTISEISYACGFETLSYFNRVFLFKKAMTPSAFRKKNSSEE
jgi:AraC-like DNA-binding protein